MRNYQGQVHRLEAEPESVMEPPSCGRSPKELVPTTQQWINRKRWMDDVKYNNRHYLISIIVV